MSDELQNGSFLKARRQSMGLRQRDLAEKAGLSPTYLNLIEANKRGISKNALAAIAHALGTTAEQLLADMRALDLPRLDHIAREHVGMPVAKDQLQSFAVQHPTWAEIVRAQADRIEALERALVEQVDRNTNDPMFSESLYEIVSTVTAIQSTAAILGDADEIEPGLRRRFQDNMQADSERLVEAARGLADHVAFTDVEVLGPLTAQEQFSNRLKELAFHFPGIEQGRSPQWALEAYFGDLPEHVQHLAAQHLDRYRRAMLALPMDRLQQALDANGFDIPALLSSTGVSLDVLCQRIAWSERADTSPTISLIITDQLGLVSFVQNENPLSFPLPGRHCDLQVLQDALQRPLHPVHQTLERAQGVSVSSDTFDAYAFAEFVTPATFQVAAKLEATVCVVSK